MLQATVLVIHPRGSCTDNDASWFQSNLHPMTLLLTNEGKHKGQLKMFGRNLNRKRGCKEEKAFIPSKKALIQTSSLPLSLLLTRTQTYKYMKDSTIPTFTVAHLLQPRWGL